MNNEPFVIVELVNDSSIVAAYIRDDESEAVKVGVKIVMTCAGDSDETNKPNEDEVRKALTDDSYWTDGSGWVVSITQVSPL